LDREADSWTLVFSTSESDAFLSALVSEPAEPWIYTQGIQLAIDFFQISFEELLSFLTQVMPKLDGEVLKSKTTLDQTLAGWVFPLLPDDKKDLQGKAKTNLADGVKSKCCVMAR
jgi:hypothetical protein